MRVLLVLAALPLIASCGGGSQQPSGGGSASSGLQGTVARGPITPTCSANEPCTAPARDVTLTFSKAGKVVAHVTTGDDGSYRVKLDSGRYFVLGAGQPVRPQQVDVPASGFRRVDFAIDTKIR